MSINYGSHDVSTSGSIVSKSGNFTAFLTNGIQISPSLNTAGIHKIIFNGYNILGSIEADEDAEVLNLKGDSAGKAWVLDGKKIRTQTLATFTALDNQPPEVSFATLDTRNNIAVLDFSDTLNEYAIFLGCMPDSAALGSGIIVRILWTATSATSGNCRWGVRFEKMNSDTDYSDNFDYNTEVNSAADATNGTPSITTLTCTNIDSLAAGNFFRIQIYRDAEDTGNDTMTGDAELIAVELRSVS